MRYLFTVSFLLIFICFVYAVDERPYINVKGALCLQSNFSKGNYSIEKIAELARQKNIKIIIMSDDILRRWEYGIRPLQNIVKKRVEENSVLKIGPEKYLTRIKKVNSPSHGVIIVEGITAAAFYWWDGSLFKRNLSLNDWNREILVVGLDNPKDYKELPIVGNRAFMPKNLKDISKIMLALLVVFLGLFLISKKITRKIIFKDVEFIAPILLYKRLGYILISLGIIFLWNNWSFPTSNFDQYHGDQKLVPYQEFIDYVNKRGGLCFWVHPEGAELMSVGRVATYTYKPQSLLKDTYGYCGFSVIELEDKVNDAALAGNIWDEILQEYCQAKRKHPVWAIGELGFQNDKEVIDRVQTIFLIKELNRQTALGALKNGKIYAKLEHKENSLNLEDFSIQDKNSNKMGFMGDEILCSTVPFINISGNFQEPDKIRVDLIRNGKLIQRFEINESPFRIGFFDELPEKGKKTYYRLYIESTSGTKIISNPIFLTNAAG